MYFEEKRKNFNLPLSPELLFKDIYSARRYARIVEVNKDKNQDIINFLERWGKAMQYLIEVDGKSVAESADATQFTCDLEGMSGMTFGLAVRTLCDVWKYGEELRLWHNKQYGYEGEGVVNPAIINIGL